MVGIFHAEEVVIMETNLSSILIDVRFVSVPLPPHIGTLTCTLLAVASALIEIEVNIKIKIRLHVSPNEREWMICQLTSSCCWFGQHRSSNVSRVRVV